MLTTCSRALTPARPAAARPILPARRAARVAPARRAPAPAAIAAPPSTTAPNHNVDFVSGNMNWWQAGAGVSWRWCRHPFPSSCCRHVSDRSLPRAARALQGALRPRIHRLPPHSPSLCFRAGVVLRDSGALSGAAAARGPRARPHSERDRHLTLSPPPPPPQNEVPLAAPPPFTLADIKASIPDACFQKNALKSFAYLAWDVAVVLGLAAAAFTYAPAAPWLWPLYWVAQGTMFWALFVVGHDW